ncbi:MAG TPA: EF-hand domain-containing protein [Sinorhizobium sp.]|nr:EF-hand domain-containing protein [Sinorhizobium sp.]
MRNPITFVLTGAVLAASLSFPALADKGHGLFQRADKDGDGFVTKLEFTGSRDVMFQSIDANKDGVLTQDELDAARAAWRQKMGKPAHEQTQEQAGDQAQQKPGKERHGRFMKRIDANEDGQITAAEFAAAGEKMFARLDDNSDGRIAQEELPKRKHKHKQDEAPAEQPAQ